MKQTLPLPTDSSNAVIILIQQYQQPEIQRVISYIHTAMSCNSSVQNLYLRPRIVCVCLCTGSVWADRMERREVGNMHMAAAGLGCRKGITRLCVLLYWVTDSLLHLYKWAYKVQISPCRSSICGTKKAVSGLIGASRFVYLAECTRTIFCVSTQEAV